VLATQSRPATEVTAVGQTVDDLARMMNIGFEEVYRRPAVWLRRRLLVSCRGRHRFIAIPLPAALGVFFRSVRVLVVLPLLTKGGIFVTLSLSAPS
jgi:hypothetical protein